MRERKAHTPTIGQRSITLKPIGGDPAPDARQDRASRPSGSAP